MPDMQGNARNAAVWRLRSTDEEEELTGVILKLTLTTAELAGENPAEWEALEQLVQMGQWTTTSRADECRLRYLASRLKVPLTVEGDAVLPTRRRTRWRSSGSP